MASWQLQEAKQRFSELVRQAHNDGPQVVTRHGEEIAVIIDIGQYRRLTGATPDFTEFLLADPWDDEITFPRNRDLPREVDFG